MPYKLLYIYFFFQALLIKTRIITVSRRRVFFERVRCTRRAFVLNTEYKSAFATPCIFVRRAITPIYTPWETHGARVVDSSNGNIMERFYEREEALGRCHSNVM